jgi:hypothetical protein
MSKFRWLLAALTVCCASTSNAQVTIEQLPNIHLSGNFDLTLTRLANTVAAQTRISATLYNASAVVKAIIPTLDKTLGCANLNNQAAVTVTAIRTVSPFVFVAEADVKGCTSLTRTVINGSVTVTVPITVAVAANKRSVTLALGEIDVHKSGFVLVSIFARSNYVEDQVKIRVRPAFQTKIAALQAGLNRLLTTAAIQKQIKAYGIAIESPAVTFINDDLTVEATVTGQTTTKAVNGWLAGMF